MFNFSKKKMTKAGKSGLEGKFALFKQTLFSGLFGSLKTFLMFVKAATKSPSLFRTEVYGLVFFTLNNKLIRGYMNGTALGKKIKI